MRAVNLLPRDDAKRGPKISPPVLTGVVTGVLVITILCAGFLLESAKVTDQRNELDAARAELAMVPPPEPPKPGASETLAGEHSARVGALQTALNGRIAWDRVLRELALVMPSDVWLTHLVVRVPGAANADGSQTTGQPFDISGNTYSHDGVARLLSRLQVVPDLDAVRLDHSRALAPGKRGTVEFKILAGIRTADVVTP
jgi:hypothetical protein